MSTDYRDAFLHPLRSLLNGHNRFASDGFLREKCSYPESTAMADNKYVNVYFKEATQRH